MKRYSFKRTRAVTFTHFRYISNSTNPKTGPLRRVLTFLRELICYSVLYSLIAWLESSSSLTLLFSLSQAKQWFSTCFCWPTRLFKWSEFTNCLCRGWCLSGDRDRPTTFNIGWSNLLLLKCHHPVMFSCWFPLTGIYLSVLFGCLVIFKLLSGLVSSNYDCCSSR